MVEVTEAFRGAVTSYLEAISKDFHRLPQGEDINFRPCMNKISGLYRKAPTATRDGLLYFVLKTMCKAFEDERLKSRCRKLALELTKELEKI